MKCKSILFFLFVLFITMQTVYGQDTASDQVVIAETTLKKISSKYIPDEIFHLQINLPEDYYDMPSQKYPVIYVTDGDYNFGIATDMVDYFRYGGFMPQVIIVGIGYGTKDWNNGNMRDRDFMPYPNKDGEIGAEKFHKFLTEEVVPLIEKEYRIDKSNTTLFGVSLAGKFLTYSLFTNPNAFTNYIINSPVYTDANRWAFKMDEEYFKQHKNLPTNLYMSMGDKEIFYPAFKEFIEIFESRNYSELNLKIEYIKDGRHHPIIADAFSRGVKHIFNKPSIYELMSNLIDEHGINYAVEEYRKLKKTNENEYNFGEGELNTLGYFLLSLNKNEDATQVFKLNTEMFSESANAFDSLSDAYIATGKKKEALKVVNIILELLSKYPEQNSTGFDKYIKDKLKSLQSN